MFIGELNNRNQETGMNNLTRGWPWTCFEKITKLLECYIIHCFLKKEEILSPQFLQSFTFIYFDNIRKDYRLKQANGMFTNDSES